MRFYHQIRGFNVAKVVRLVGLVSRVLLIFGKRFLHFWKDLMSNLSQEVVFQCKSLGKSIFRHAANRATLI